MADAFECLMSGAQSSRGARTTAQRKRAGSVTDLEAELVQSASQVHEMVSQLDMNYPAAETTLKRKKTRAAPQQGVAPPPKRRRVTTKERDMLDRPGAITYERSEHMFITMAYCGLEPERCFMNASIATQECRTTEIDDELLRGGVSWIEAYQVSDTLTKPSLDFIETLRALSTNKNPSEGATMYKALHRYMAMALSSYEFCASPVALASRDAKCFIDAKPCKPTEKLFRVALRMYAVDKMDYRRIRPRNAQPLTFNVNPRYINVLFGTWYLFHLPFLFGSACAMWVATVQGLPQKRRDAEFAGFDGAHNLDLARMFVAKNAGSCERLLATAVKLSQTIEKRNQEYKKQLSAL